MIYSKKSVWLNLIVGERVNIRENIGFIIVLPLLIILFLVINYYSKEDVFFQHYEFKTKNSVSTISPYGEEPRDLSYIVALTNSIDTVKTRKKSIKVAISMHDTDNYWSKALLKGLKKTLEFYNVEIVAITDGEFNLDKQIVDINNIIRLKPDYLISLPLDTKLTSDIYKKAVDKGIKLIFLDSVPENFKPGVDYLSFIVGDSYRLGELSAKNLIEDIGGEGDIATLNWSNNMFTVNKRREGAIKEFSSNRDINIVQEVYFNKFHEIPQTINDLLKKEPNLKGLWTVWDTPALEAMKSLKSSSSNIVISTVDLNRKVARSILSGDLIKSTAVDHPYYAGIAAALLIILNSENLECPSYIVTHAEIVTKKNIKELWKELYREPFSHE